MASPAYLDRFSFVGHFVIIEGWASDLELALWYDGRPLEVAVSRISRPDLVATFGLEAEGWGFAACVAMHTTLLERSRIRLQLNRDIPDADIRAFVAASDASFEAMTAAFQASVAQKAEASLLEIGSRARSGNSYRSWFPTVSHYTGLDVMAGPNVDVVGDAHHLARVVGRTFDFMFSIAVFEHILMPWKVALEMNRSLTDGGQALIISHGAWPLHEEPWDFFRFSKDSWRGIFNVHTGFRVVDAQYQYPASIVPQYASDPHFEVMSRGLTYLLSGCVVQKIGEPQVSWEAEVGDIYDLNYSHA